MTTDGKQRRELMIDSRFERHITYGYGYDGPTNESKSNA